MLGRVRDRHGHGTRLAGAGMFLSTRDHRSVGYKVPKEWGSLPVGLKGAGSLAAFKRQSRAGFLDGYGAFQCGVHSCYVCVPGEGVVGARSQRGMVAE